MPELEQQQARIVTLESTVMYLQHDLEQIHQVVLEQQKQLDDLQRQLDRFAKKLATEAEELPDPLDERPPHY